MSFFGRNMVKSIATGALAGGVLGNLFGEDKPGITDNILNAGMGAAVGAGIGALAGQYALGYGSAKQMGRRAARGGARHIVGNKTMRQATAQAMTRYTKKPHNYAKMRVDAHKQQASAGMHPRRKSTEELLKEGARRAREAMNKFM